MQTLESLAKAINTFNPRARYFYLCQDYRKGYPVYILAFSERATRYYFYPAFEEEDYDHNRASVGWTSRLPEDEVGRIEVPRDFDFSKYPIEDGVYDFSKAEAIVDDGERFNDEIERTTDFNRTILHKF